MSETCIRGGTIVTMDPDRTVVENGSIIIRDEAIVDVGAAARIAAEYEPDRIVDASEHVIAPGFINAHVHVPDILARGYEKSRSLFDWLINVKRPFVAAMTPRDHEIAAAKYGLESIRAGVTTFVENAGGVGTGYGDDVVTAKLHAYDESGIRNVYAHGFLDREPTDELADLFERLAAKRPEVVHPDEPGVADTDEALERVESLIERYHGTAEGRQRVWPGPFQAGGVSPTGLRGAYEIAERHDVMTTTHTAESPAQERGISSSVEYLDAAGYLGDRTLLGHCVQIDDRDIRLLAGSGTAVSHNITANLVLGSGVAPVSRLVTSGVTVGLGTDNACLGDTIDPLGDARTAMLVQMGTNQDPAAMRARRALEMITIDGARAIGREADLGSIEVGKKADIVLVDAGAPSMRPSPSPIQALVYQTTPAAIDTVVCNGEVVMRDNEVTTIPDAYPELPTTVAERSADIRARAGMTGIY